MGTTVTDPTPMVTVGVPVFNGETFLAESLDSLRRQTVRDIEVIISDNGSTDRSVQIAERFCEQDPRFRLIRHKVNQGGAFNHNFVVDQARAPFFKWGSHDDVCGPTLLERSIEILSQNPDAVLAYSDVQYIDNHGRHLKELRRSLNIESDSPSGRLRHFFEYYTYPREANAIIGVLRTDALKVSGRIGPYPSSDLVLMAELALAGRFVHIPELLFYRRDHRDRSTVVNRTAKEIAMWFDPRNTRWRDEFWWPMLRGYVNSINRASLPPTERLRCFRVLRHWMWRRRRSLAYELFLDIRNGMRELGYRLVGG